MEGRVIKDLESTSYELCHLSYSTEYGQYTLLIRRLGSINDSLKSVTVADYCIDDWTILSEQESQKILNPEPIVEKDY